MKLLILGGTRFLGRALVAAAQERNHEITLFNRGKSNPDLYPDAEKLIGDRDGGLQALHGRSWDAVIDTCGYFPRLVRDSARLLADTVSHYTFISTIAVYADMSEVGITESSSLGEIEDEIVEDISRGAYGPLKVLCEQAAEREMDGRALHVRAGLLVGPHDTTDRFTYWPVRLARGGEVLAPGDPDQPVQFIDVRDIANWTVMATEQRLTGPYNATGPAARLSMRRFLESARSTLEAEARFTWVSEPFLLANKVEPFMEMPLWVPAEAAGMVTVNAQKAQSAGLAFRPLAETVRDTFAWADGRPDNIQWHNGMAAKRERLLLSNWHSMMEAGGKGE